MFQEWIPGIVSGSAHGIFQANWRASRNCTRVFFPCFSSAVILAELDMEVVNEIVTWEVTVLIIVALVTLVSITYFVSLPIISLNRLIILSVEPLILPKKYGTWCCLSEMMLSDRENHLLDSCQFRNKTLCHVLEHLRRDIKCEYGIASLDLEQ